jgi:hypothetical protein
VRTPAYARATEAPKWSPPWEPWVRVPRAEAAAELREVSAEIDRLYEHHRDVPRPAGERLIFEEIQARKRERRERVKALARDGVEASLIAPAADLTRTRVGELGRSA